MYAKHPALVTPPASTVIWRYQDLGKLLSMIERRALFFSRVDLLGDPYEGAQTPGYSLARSLAAYSVAKQNPVVSNGDIVACQEEEGRRRREQVFVNCWYMGNHESDAMWRLYCRSGECVAIRSTIGGLMKALASAPHRAFLAEVKYIDYGGAFLPSDSVLQPFVHKRITFQHEHELRAIVTTDLIELDPGLAAEAYADSFHANRDGGVYVPVDLTTLIQELRLPPYAPEWFHRVVTAVLRQLGINVGVKQSSMSDRPDY